MAAPSFASHCTRPGPTHAALPSSPVVSRTASIDQSRASCQQVETRCLQAPTAPQGGSGVICRGGVKRPPPLLRRCRPRATTSFAPTCLLAPRHLSRRGTHHGWAHINPMLPSEPHGRSAARLPPPPLFPALPRPAPRRSRHGLHAHTRSAPIPARPQGPNEPWIPQARGACRAPVSPVASHAGSHQHLFAPPSGPPPPPRRTLRLLFPPALLPYCGPRPGPQIPRWAPSSRCRPPPSGAALPCIGATPHCSPLKLPGPYAASRAGLLRRRRGRGFAALACLPRCRPAGPRPARASAWRSLLWPRARRRDLTPTLPAPPSTARSCARRPHRPHMYGLPRSMRLPLHSPSPGRPSRRAAAALGAPQAIRAMGGARPASIRSPSIGRPCAIPIQYCRPPSFYQACWRALHGAGAP
jgi:hypothetical protein